MSKRSDEVISSGTFPRRGNVNEFLSNGTSAALENTASSYSMGTTKRTPTVKDLEAKRSSAAQSSSSGIPKSSATAADGKAKTTKGIGDKQSRECSSEESEISPGVRGLENTGNLCYLNSVVQCLSSTKPFTEYFIGQKWGDESVELGDVALKLCNLLTKIWRTDTKVVNAGAIVEKMTKYNDRFADGKQHDPQELLTFLFEALSIELRRCPKVRTSAVKEEQKAGEKQTPAASTTRKQATPQTSKSGGLPAKQKPAERVAQVPQKRPSATIDKAKGRQEDCESEEEDPDCETEWAKHLSMADSIVTDVFYGQLRTTVRCTNLECKHAYIRFDPFSTLSIPIPTCSNGNTVSSKELTVSSKAARPAEKYEDFTSVGTTAEHSVKVVFIAAKPYKFIRFGLKTTRSSSIAEFLDSAVKLINRTELRYFVSSSSSLWSQDKAFGIENYLITSKTAIILFRNYFIDRILFGDSLYSSERSVRVADLPIEQEPYLMYELEWSSYRLSNFLNCKLIPVYVRFQDDFRQFELANGIPLLLLVDCYEYISSRHPLEDFYDKISKTIQRYLVTESDAEFFSMRRELMRDGVKSDLKDALFDIVVQHKRGAQLQLSDDEAFSTLRDMLEEKDEEAFPIIIFADVRDRHRNRFKLHDFDLLRAQRPPDKHAHAQAQAQAPTECSLKDCLQLFCNVSQEAVAHVQHDEDDTAAMAHGFVCEKCKHIVSPVHATQLSRLPKVLIVHLKRFDADSIKVETFVKYPLTLTHSDLLEFLVSDSTFIQEQMQRDASSKSVKVKDRTLYRLVGVINHSGSLTVGHCTAICFNDVDSKWHYYSDTTHFQVPEEEVVNKNAYVLFYTQAAAKD